APESESAGDQEPNDNECHEPCQVKGDKDPEPAWISLEPPFRHGAKCRNCDSLEREDWRLCECDAPDRTARAIARIQQHLRSTLWPDWAQDDGEDSHEIQVNEQALARLTEKRDQGWQKAPVQHFHEQQDRCQHRACDLWSLDNVSAWKSSRQNSGYGSQ